MLASRQSNLHHVRATPGSNSFPCELSSSYEGISNALIYRHCVFVFCRSSNLTRRSILLWLSFVTASSWRMVLPHPPPSSRNITTRRRVRVKNKSTRSSQLPDVLCVRSITRFDRKLSSRRRLEQKAAKLRPENMTVTTWFDVDRRAL